MGAEVVGSGARRISETGWNFLKKSQNSAEAWLNRFPARGGRARMDAGPHARTGPARRTFGPFLIDSDRSELTREGAAVALRPKTFALLQYLADRAGHVIGKQELLDGVWPGVVVSDDSLTQAVSELRSALADRDQRLIRTVSRRGYLLDAKVLPAPPFKDAPETFAADSPIERKRRPLAAVVAVSVLGTVLIVGLADAVVQWQQDRAPIQTIRAAVIEGRTLVVMPFTDLSEPPAPHIALAVDTELTVDLGRLADVRVMARGSAASLGDSASADVKRIGKALDVRYVVTGSVKREGERLHITTQMARADTGALVWTERFDYVSVADWAARRDISARIANVLDTRMRDVAWQQTRGATPDRAAVDHWMRGSLVLSRVRTRAELIAARTEFEAAVAAQPDSSHALAGLAMTYVDEVMFRWTEAPEDRRSVLEKAERIARRALAIESTNQAGLLALGGSLIFNGRLDDAAVITRKHLELNPNDAAANQALAAELYFSGRWQESIDQAEWAIRLNPLDRKNTAMCESLIATALVPLRRYDEAVERGRRVLDGPRAPGNLMIASAEAWRGNMDAARAAAGDFLKRNPTSTIARDRALRGSTDPAYLAGMDHFYEGLRRAGYPEGESQPK
ncbi:winged helix-turn-helix domain-containing protein [Variovorax sp. J22R24]|uniref:winged helix-turn-helix domain-containing protein n=1 Tax=Variovorax gracilis TaxID=3053502 RepID=UPI0025758B7D|nr:winged helix-turn-helix domain-containing protein [Variovorax sp. J22R24]MDM0109369.1 winged helix-turn-helix domain-containing protein [Variovorax sp. J22R24]